MSERLGKNRVLYYQKGSIVPRIIAKSKHRKVQHMIRWGCDVIVCGKCVEAATDGYSVVVGERNRKGKYPLIVTIDGVCFQGMGEGAIKIHDKNGSI